MAIDLYYVLGSSPCRSVMLTARAIGLDLNLKLIDLQKGDHMTPEFLKLNPQHTVPTLVDDGFSLWESRAIQSYLVDKYAKDDSLYPKDLKKRALVNQRLCFDQGTLNQRLADYMYPALFGGQDFNPDNFKKLEEAYTLLDLFLGLTPYTAGNQLTIADLAVVTTVGNSEVAGVNVSKFPNVAKWYSKVQKEIPGYAEIGAKDVESFRQFFNHVTAGKKK